MNNHRTTTFTLAVALSGLCTFSLLAKEIAADARGVAAQQKGVAIKAEKAPKPRIEVCFVLDTTGSMSGLIEGAKQKIWSIANEMISAKPTPDIKVGLVAYRDRGDEYVTKVFDLNADIDAVYADLQKFKAGGGGDGPESVNEALDDAVRKMTWSEDKSVLKMIFLVGDAPPHMDYKDGPKYPDVCQRAMRRDLIVNTVQCGKMQDTTPVWKEIAKLSEGIFVAIAQTGGMAAIATPVDDEIAKLNRDIGGTLIATGSESVRRQVATKQVASEAAAPSVAADRLSYNLRSGGKVVATDGDLVNLYSEGKVNFKALKKDELPKELQGLSEEDFKKQIEVQQKKREDLQNRIVKLGLEREAFIAAEKKKLAASGKGDSFDEKVADTIRAQAARKGIHYEK